MINFKIMKTCMMGISIRLWVDIYVYFSAGYVDFVAHYVTLSIKNFWYTIYTHGDCQRYFYQSACLCNFIQIFQKIGLHLELETRIVGLLVRAIQWCNYIY